ncbi:hypothetical protein B0H11DRAFT_2187861 [Mycena galericulata]|nr:hypothetical protein B0H11DRAFT_2187861 [Mycena galericulata]
MTGDEAIVAPQPPKFGAVGAARGETPTICSNSDSGPQAVGPLSHRWLCIYLGGLEENNSHQPPVSDNKFCTLKPSTQRSTINGFHVIYGIALLVPADLADPGKHSTDDQSGLRRRGAYTASHGGDHFDLTRTFVSRPAKSVDLRLIDYIGPASWISEQSRAVQFFLELQAHLKVKDDRISFQGCRWAKRASAWCTSSSIQTRLTAPSKPSPPEIFVGVGGTFQDSKLFLRKPVDSTSSKFS